MAHYDTDWEITPRSSSVFQGNSDFMNKIEADDRSNNRHEAILHKTGSYGKVFYKLNRWTAYREFFIHWKYYASLCMVLFESNKGCGKYLKATHNKFMHRQECIINIATLHPCTTSYVPCHDWTNLKVLREKKSNISRFLSLQYWAGVGGTLDLQLRFYS